MKRNKDFIEFYELMITPRLSKTIRRKTMKNALSNVGGWLNGFVGLLKTVIVFFVFAAIVWPVGLANVVGGIVNLVNMLLGGGVAGLLALCVFCSFMD